MKRIAVVVLVATSLSFLLLLFSSTKTQAQFSIPIILSAGVDVTNNKLKIGGTNFGASPKVALGTTPLNTQSATGTEIVTDFSSSAFLPGTYVIKVQFSNGTLAVFVLSLGSLPTATTSCGTHAPVVLAPTPFITGIVYQSLFVAGFQFSDEDIASCGANETLTLDSRFIIAPPLSSAVINNRTSPMPWFTPDVPGIYIVRVTVTDSTGRTGQADLFVSIAAF